MIDLNSPQAPNPSNFDTGSWKEWKPLWTDKKLTPHDFQEVHSPTKIVKPRTKARITDIRLWNSMTPPQQDAAIEIASSFETLTKGIGYNSINWQKIPGTRSSHNISELHAELINIYMQWGEKCIKRSISHSMVIDILCYGLSCSVSDRERRIRKGGSKKNLLEGLEVYCKMRGWD